MRQAEVDELEAVAFVAGAEAEDRLGLAVGFPEKGVGVVHLPAHEVRIGEPQAHVVDADVTEKRVTPSWSNAWRETSSTLKLIWNLISLASRSCGSSESPSGAGLLGSSFGSLVQRAP